MVTIIVPNYNHRKFLPKRLDSIFNQTYQNFEVILLDDASTDDSWNYLSQYENHPKVSYCIRNEINSGSPFKQWKKGLNLANNELIWIAESDDFCDYEFLSTLVRIITSSSNLGLAYAQSFDVDENESVLYDRLNWTMDFSPNIWNEDWQLNGGDFIKSYLNVKNVIPNASAVVFKKSHYLSAPWDKIQSMKLCGDWLFWSSIIPKSNVGFCKDHLNFFRHNSNATRNHNTLSQTRSRLLEEWEIRKFLFYEFNIPYFRMTFLQKSWFHSGFYIKDLFEKDIYELNIYPNKILFVINFLIYKFFYRL